MNAKFQDNYRTPRKHRSSVCDGVLSLYRDGYTQEEILALGKSLPRSRTEQAPRPLAQSTISRWITNAKEADPDLEIWHLLNRRKRWPGIYTNWKPAGQIILGPFYDRLTDTMYLGPGMDFIPMSVLVLADRIGFAVAAPYNSQTMGATTINVHQPKALAPARASSTVSASFPDKLKAVNIVDFTATIIVRSGAEVVLNLTADSQVQINGVTVRGRIPRNIVRRGPKMEPPDFKMNDSDAAGPYLAELRSFGYSQRDLIQLWKGQPTKQLPPKLAKSQKMRELVSMLRNIKAKPFGIGTINRILKTYSHIDNRDAEVRMQEHVL